MQKIQYMMLWMPLLFQKNVRIEEDLAMQDSVSNARDLADRLLSLKSILTGLADFRMTSASIQDFLRDNPGSNQSTSLQDLKTLYLSLREMADLSIEDAVAAVRDKAKLHSSSATPISSPSEHPTCKSDLPVIEVPKFYGNKMSWSTFWNSSHWKQEGPRQHQTPPLH